MNLAHDYANQSLAHNISVGVVEALDNFIKGADYESLFLPLESCPTYVLPRSGIDHAVGNIITQALHGAPTTIKIVASERRTYVQRMAKFSDGTQKQYFHLG